MITTTHRIPPSVPDTEAVTVTMTVADLRLISGRDMPAGGVPAGTSIDLTLTEGVLTRLPDVASWRATRDRLTQAAAAINNLIGE